MNRLPAIVSALLLGAATACSTAKPGGGAESASSARAPRAGGLVRPESLPPLEPSRQVTTPVIPAPADTATGERATIARLEREARALAHREGCTRAAACRVAPLGVKACGGPRAFVAYCAATTDTLALMRKLRELERAEKAYNDRSGMMSTCEVRLAPQPALVAGSCTEATGAGPGATRVP